MGSPKRKPLFTPPSPKRGRGRGETEGFPQRGAGASPCLPRARGRCSSLTKSSSAGLCYHCLRRGGAASSAVRTRGGYPNKFPWELVRYIGGTASPLYERQRFSCRSGSARCGRSRHPRAATDAPRRRCGSCPTGRPADDGCPMRSSRSSPERLPESASCR